MTDSPSITLKTKFVIIITNVFFIGFIVNTLKKKYLISRFALPWILLAITNILFTIFHKIVFKLSSALGFKLPVNFYFFVMNIFFMWRIFSLSLKSYKLEHLQKNVIQYNTVNEIK